MFLTWYYIVYVDRALLHSTNGTACQLSKHTGGLEKAEDRCHDDLPLAVSCQWTVFKLPHFHYTVWIFFLLKAYSLLNTWWRHQMETFSALLAICAGNSPVPVNSPHKGQWRGALMFSLICTRINGWVNNGEAGDLRRNSAHYDVTVMIKQYRIYPMKYAHCSVMLCFVVVVLSIRCGFIWCPLPIFFRITSLALGQSCDCPSASEITLKDMGKLLGTKPQQNITMRKSCE